MARKAVIVDDGCMATSVATQQQPVTEACEVVKPRRVLSVDTLRGMTIALMILVNDPGDWKHIFRPLEHAEWNGWTITDLVFPTFLFLVGASTIFSMNARAAQGSCKATLTGRIFGRAGKIFLLDLLLVYFPRMSWHSMRIYGVLTRIALCYLIAGLILLMTRRVRWIVTIIAVLLVGYWVLLRWVPVPGVGVPGRDMPFMDPNLNLAAWMDRGAVAWTQRWLHTGALYNHTRDPEGLLSTLPAVATTLLGALTGMWMTRPQWRLQPHGERKIATGLVAAGAVLFAAGELWSRWFPINKNLWTSSFVLLTAGIAAMLLGAWSAVVDGHAQPWRRWLHVASWPWLVFGSNAIAAYVISAVLVKAGLFVHLRGGSVWLLAYRDVFARAGSSNWTSLAFAVSFVCVCFVPVWLLWRKRIFLKL